MARCAVDGRISFSTDSSAATVPMPKLDFSHRRSTARRGRSVPEFEDEAARMRVFFAKLARSKRDSIRFLKDAGILDESGALAEPYRD